MLRFKCKKCETELESPDSLLAKHITCPECGQSNFVPDPKFDSPERYPKSTSSFKRDDFYCMEKAISRGVTGGIWRFVLQSFVLWFVLAIVLGLIIVALAG